MSEAPARVAHASRIAAFATTRPRLVMWLAAAFAIVLGAQIPRINIDTDPENMLPADEPNRVFHNEVEDRFALYDAIVVGAVNDRDPEGIYNARSLAALGALTTSILGIDGVIRPDVMSLSTSDNITQEGPGTIRFEWMMRNAPEDAERALEIRDSVRRLPLMLDTLVSGDDRAAAVYVPIESKDMSYRISEEIRTLTQGLDSEDTYHITGLPVAEDTFGHDMFVQMGISAPLAGLMIFLLMWYFFKSPTLVAAPMIVAMITVIATMGLLIGLGFTVHIMSSMIPIFLMPIAVVDSVHIMSEFADLYEEGKDPKAVIREVVGDLFKPMLFTSVTSAVGFLSLLLTPIPPVQVFGVFVAFGVLLAFAMTIVMVPAYVVLMSPKGLAKLHRSAVLDEEGSLTARIVRGVGRVAFGRRGAVIGVSVVVLAVSAVGVSRIVINDNPVRWFKASHDIRVADRVLNEHFAGTYDAFLVLSRPLPEAEIAGYRDRAARALQEIGDQQAAAVLTAALEGLDAAGLDPLIARLDDVLFEVSEADAELIEPLMESAESLQRQSKYFQRPDALAYIEDLQTALMASGGVGKTNALPDVVKVVNRELRGGADGDYAIPSSANGVAQALLQYQSSHRPQDLWHMVTPDFTSTAIWVQLRSGDNQDMVAVTEAMEAYLQKNPAADGVRVQWAGKSYINVVWQQAMVEGMLKSLLGAFAVVFLMMTFLFRSPTLGVVAMLPLTLTIAFVYGLIGWTGKYYDMPIAVLSALTLGLSVDFAIHFVQRFRSLTTAGDSFEEAQADVFEEPGRAIFRNAVVIALGFTPLFFAPLVPYITVGAFMAAIMAISALVTLFLLPAVLSFARRALTAGRAPDSRSASNAEQVLEGGNS